jgi:DNA modification methylase
MLSADWDTRQYQVWQTNAMNLPIQQETVDTIISSPPYFGALDYARDNRLRLWFLGCEDWKQLDKSLTAHSSVYITQMSACLREMERVLKPGGYCVLILGDVNRNGKLYHTAEILGELAGEVSAQRLQVELIYDDIIPDERRSRRKTKTTRFERILIMRKTS